MPRPLILKTRLRRGFTTRSNKTVGLLVTEVTILNSRHL